MTPDCPDSFAPGVSSRLAPGVSFGGYVIHELIGRGGMASVYRAEHLLLNKPVALKVMDRSLLATAGARQRFVLEGRAAAAIKHPNVVDITDVGVHDDVPYLVMELLTGVDLAVQLERRGPLDEAATVRLALPIIAALHAAHQSGVVHRDIKPSNIFLSQGPDDQVVPKVLDFGISKVAAESASQELSLTPQHHVMGTPRYLPPEALHGGRDLGPASDQFSLGVVLYECVTGRTPFAGETLIALLNALSAGSFRPPRALAPGISVGLDRVIMRALSVDPRQRFPTIRDMGRALLELAAERTQMVWGHSFKSWGDDGARRPSASPTEPLDRLARPSWARYRRVAFGAGFITLGALASALVSPLLAPRGARSVWPGEPAAPAPVISAAALTAPVEAVEAVAAEPEPAPAPRIEAVSEAPPREPAAERPRRAPVRPSSPARAPRPAERAPRPERSSRADKAPAAAAPAEPAPAAPPEPPPPGAAPAGAVRRGANGSPLLD